jgi:hypothetical protein
MQFLLSICSEGECKHKMQHKNLDGPAGKESTSWFWKAINEAGK